MADPIDITKPTSATTPAGSVATPSIDQQIAGDRYNKAVKAAGKVGSGLIFSKLIPAAANPDQQGTNGAGQSFDQPG